MNIVDLVILSIMSMSIVIGTYNGFLLSALHAASFFLSWVIAVIFYPILTKIILGLFPGFLNTITFYVDGSSQIPDVENRMAGIGSFTQDQVARLVDKINLPNPFGRVLASDVFQSADGLHTLGEYFDKTMAAVIINIISFILLFLLIKFAFTIAIGIGKAIRSLPVLKQFDSLAGAGFGLIRGFFMVYLFFALIPIIMALAPAGLIHKYLDGSVLSGFFYNTNIFTSFVRGSL
jgi:uncharacterized membrane protein required for colicin V production